MNSPRDIRIVIADDHAIVRYGLRSLLEDLEHVDVVGEASDGRAALEMASEVIPDVVLMDVWMPELNGISATRKLTRSHPNVRTLMLTMDGDPQLGVQVARAGARGLILKDLEPSRLTSAIERVHAGKVVFAEDVIDAIINTFIREHAADSGSAVVYADAPPPTVLTKREREVLRLVASGLTSREIADGLRISTRTVETHRSRIAAKLDLNTVADLTRYAIEHKIA